MEPEGQCRLLMALSRRGWRSMDEMWGKIAKMEREWEKVGKVVGSKPGEVRLDLAQPAISAGSQIMNP